MFSQVAIVVRAHQRAFVVAAFVVAAVLQACAFVELGTRRDRRVPAAQVVDVGDP